MHLKKNLKNNVLSLLVAGAGLAVGMSAGSAFGQALTFTDGQAGTGAGVYKQFCETCHGDTLQGLLEAPPLTGPKFATWKGLAVRDLYDFIKEYMPQDKPGSLSKKQYADLTAYILKFNNIPGGAAELPEDPPRSMIIPK